MLSFGVPSVTLTVESLNGVINKILVQHHSSDRRTHSAAETPVSESEDATSVQDCRVKGGSFTRLLQERHVQVEALPVYFSRDRKLVLGHCLILQYVCELQAKPV